MAAPAPAAEQGTAPLRHLAIIMDGNQRWAKQRKLSVSRGHRAGAEAARAVLRSCARYKVEILTLFAFSSENWRRPQAEVQGLLSLMRLYLRRELQALHEEGVRLRFIGDLGAFGPTLRRQVKEAEQLTADNHRHTLVVAAGYGGRWDIVRAAQGIARRAVSGELAPEELTEEIFADALCTAGLPEPDLCIRTGGEQRVSNFLLWQFAYTEFYFSELLWPDFDERALAEALDAYTARRRRYGLRR